MQDSSRTILQPPADTSSGDTSLVSHAADSIAKPARKAIHFKAKTDSVLNAEQDHDLTAATLSRKKASMLSASTEKAKTINFFGDHELKVNHHGPQSFSRITPDWVFPILLLVVVAFAWLRTFYNKYFIQVITAFFNNNLTNQIVRDENILVQRASILLNIVYNLVAALFLYFVSVHLDWSLGGIDVGFNRYIFIALIICAAYAMKFLVLKICGYLFDLQREMATCIFNISLVNNVLGILLIPVVALLAFSTTVNTMWVIYVSVFIIGGAFLYSTIRSLLVGITSPFSSIYYLFLYLCTLEFAPLLVLIKILNQR